jgi:mxaC protein
MTWSAPWILILLPLALLPFWWARPGTLEWSDLSLLPDDPVSKRLDQILKGLGALAIASVLIAWAHPYSPQSSFPRVGHGAEIVLLLDRSRSMDQKFGPETNRLNATDEMKSESKAEIAKSLIADFARGRSHDVFSMIDFTNIAIPTLDFTHKPDAVQAAITGANIGRGLADTDIGQALVAAGERFSDRAYTGSRIVLLVSDGGGQIEPDLRKFITQLYKRNRIALYWVYIRSYYSPPLTGPIDTDNEEAIPERFLHHFFEAIGIPYHAYEAQNPQALKNAIEDVGRLEAHPITLMDATPQRDYAIYFYASAFICTLILALSQFAERRVWR